MCASRKALGVEVTYREVPWPPPSSSDKHWLSSEYLEYLKSPQWRAFRKKALVSADYQCADPDCTVSTRLHVHHLNYAQLGRESLTDVKVLCNFHHAAEHRRISQRNLEDARFEGWARKVYGDDSDYDNDYAWDRYLSWRDSHAG